MSSLRIEAPDNGNARSSRLWFYLIILSLAGLVSMVAWFFLQRSAPKAALPLEITNFTGKPQFYSADEKRWRIVSRSDVFRNGDKLVTVAGEDVDLKAPDLLYVRLQENSVLVNGGGIYDNKKSSLPLYRLKLDQGAVLGATVKGFKQKAQLHLVTPEVVFTSFDTSFEVRVGAKQTWIGVLNGVGEIRRPPFYSEVIPLRSLRKSEIKGSQAVQALPISREEWDHMKEAYELIPRSAAYEAEQIDLAKKAGSLYDYVFDHGTFYTPDIGYALRDFIPNESTGRTELTIEYDVFPRGSYVGMYMKTRDLDLSRFDALELDARIAPDSDELKEFQIEMKSKGSVVRRLAAKIFTKEWKTFNFPLQANRETPIQEINFLFSNEKVGEYKKGMIQLRNMNLVPRTTPLPVPAKVAAQSVQKVKPAEIARPETTTVLPAVNHEIRTSVSKIPSASDVIAAEANQAGLATVQTKTAQPPVAVPSIPSPAQEQKPLTSDASPDVFPEDF